MNKLLLKQLHHRRGRPRLGEALRLSRNYLLTLLSATCLISQAQQIQTASVVNSNAVVQGSTNFTVVARTANSRTWQRTVPMFTNSQAQIRYRTNSYTELATGMHHQVGSNWVAANENIEITAWGGKITNGQHWALFTGNLNQSNAVEVITPDGKALKTHLLGLSYYDASSGSNVLFAQLQDSVGQLVRSNQVVYTNAFTRCSVDVRYTYRRSGFEQDIIVKKGLPNPSTWGLNPTNTRLQVWTEFSDPPSPTLELTGRGTEVNVDFGKMKLGKGKAFVIGNESNSVPVNKRWVVVQGRSFLVEEVPIGAIAAKLQRLGSPSSVGTTNDSVPKLIQYQGFPNRLPPIPRPNENSNRSLELASTSAVKETGLVLDYDLDSDQTDFTFQGDTTYYVTGPVNLSGTTTIEGGTVIKFSDEAPEWDGDWPYYRVGLNILGSLVCPKGLYRTAILTSKDDDTAGDMIPSSSHVPSMGTENYYLRWDGSDLTLRNLRFSFAYTAVVQGGQMDIWDCQFAACDNSIICLDPNGSGLNLHNVLFCTGNLSIAASGANPAITCEQITSDNIAFIDEDYYLPSFDLKNCIINNWTGFSRGNFTSEALVLNPPGWVWLTAGAGNYYLVDWSPYRNVGATDITPDMLNELRQKTTDWPVGLVNNYTYNPTLSARVQRDTDTPDLGYHYDPIDYLVSVSVDHGTLTMANGVVLAYYNSGGINLLNGSHLVSQGSPNAHNYLVYYNLVQEQPGANFADSVLNALPINTYHTDSSQNPSISMRFTTIIVPEGAVFVMRNDYLSPSLNSYVSSFTMRDCEVFGGNAFWWMQDPSTSLIGLTNNYIQYAWTLINTSGQVNARNNLFRGDANQAVSILHSGSVPHVNSDDVFDGLPVYALDGNLGHNAYVNGALCWVDLQTGDINCGYVDWVAGPLGDFYLDSSGLVDAGSRSAGNAALYHYTTQTSQAKEGVSTVDMGYHYAAVDENGIAYDSNGNGIPDCLEDSAGNGQITVILTSPTANATIAEPANFHLQATVYDWSAPVTSVDFFRGSTKLATTGSSPYQFDWPLVSVGQYTLTAVANDANGASTTSAPVNVKVNNLCNP